MPAWDWTMIACEVVRVVESIAARMLTSADRGGYLGDFPLSPTA